MKSGREAREETMTRWPRREEVPQTRRRRTPAQKMRDTFVCTRASHFEVAVRGHVGQPAAGLPATMRGF